MKRSLKNLSEKIKRLAEGKTIGLSFSAIWTGIFFASVMWVGLVGIVTIGILAFTNETIYAIEGLLKLITWSIFFLGGFIAAYKARFKGGQHGLWTGLFLGLFSIIFLLKIIPTLMVWQQVILQLGAALILGTSGGLVGIRILQNRRDRQGYSFKEARRKRFFS